MSTLSAYRRNVYSQNGEDGVLNEIFKRMSLVSGEFVEFGAWDGMHLSNTRALLEQDWRGIYIEADNGRFKTLVENMIVFKERVNCMQAFVQPDGINSLDRLLSRTSIDNSFDLLSIDIDSFDWHVWRGLKNYKPKIVVIEINSSIPVGIYQTHHNASICGSSFSAMLDLGMRKGYTLVCHTGNMIFVRNDFVSMINLPEEEVEYPETLFDYGVMHLAYDFYIPRPLLRSWKYLLRIFNR